MAALLRNHWRVLLLFVGSSLVILTAAGIALFQPPPEQNVPPLPGPIVLSHTVPPDADCLRWQVVAGSEPSRDPVSGFRAFGPFFLLPFFGGAIFETEDGKQDVVATRVGQFFAEDVQLAFRNLPGPNGFRALSGSFVSGPNTADTCARTPLRTVLEPELAGSVQLKNAGDGPLTLTIRLVSVPLAASQSIRRHPGPALLFSVGGYASVMTRHDGQMLSVRSSPATSLYVPPNTPYQVFSDWENISVFLLVTISPSGAAVETACQTFACR